MRLAGGAGLYAAFVTAVNVIGSTFVNNSAARGGGAVSLFRFGVSVFSNARWDQVCGMSRATLCDAGEPRGRGACRDHALALLHAVRRGLALTGCKGPSGRAGTITAQHPVGLETHQEHLPDA